jgi:hypothetical protein
MRKSLMLLGILAIVVPTTSALAATTIIRTGQVAGAPGSCGGLDDNFHYFAPNVNCGQPIVSAPFQAADFAAACAGPQAAVISPTSLPWIASLPCDPDARWIGSSVIPGSCYGAGVSVLYCAPFSSQCTVADSIRICWAVDDFLGDDPSFGGPNPGGVYINGVDLGPAFSGPGSNPQYSAVAYNVPLNLGANNIEVYQRDAGCSVSGLILSATVYSDCSGVPTESTSWGSIKSTFR